MIGSFSTFFEAALKPTISGILSFYMALTPIMPESTGKSVELVTTALSEDPVHISVKYDISTDGMSLPVFFETAGYTGTVDIYADLENAKCNVIYDDGKGYIYADSRYIVTDPALSGRICAYDEKNFAVDHEHIYKEYFDGKCLRTEAGYSLDPENLGLSIGDYNVGIGDETTDARLDMLSELFAFLTAPENIEIIGKIDGRIYGLLEKYFNCTVADGKTTCNFYMDGLDLSALLIDIACVCADKEYAASVNALGEKALSEFDGEAYAKRFFGEQATQEHTDAVYGTYHEDFEVFFSAMDEEERNTVQAFCKNILTYDADYELTPYDSDDISEYYAYLTAGTMRPFFENSYAELTVTDDGGNITADVTFVLSDGERVYIDADLEIAFSDYDGEIVSASDITNVFGAEDYRDAVCYERAKTDGVFGFRLSFTEYDEPQDEMQHCMLDIGYLDEDMKRILSTPSYELLGEDTKGQILELFKARLENNYSLRERIWIDIKQKDGIEYFPLERFFKYCDLNFEWLEGSETAAFDIMGEKAEIHVTVIDGELYANLDVFFEKLAEIREPYALRMFDFYGAGYTLYEFNVLSAG